MRILHLLSQTELTGSEVHAHVLIKKQTDEKKTIFAISDQFHLNFPCQTLNLPIATNSFWQRMTNIINLRRFILANKIDIIHSHSRAACRHAFWARLGTDAVQVTTLHGRQHMSLSKKLFNIYGHFIITICENLKKSIVHDFHIKENEVRVIRNPFELASFPFRTESRPPVRLALISRASGPKGTRLQAVVLHCLETWLRRHNNLEIEIITSSLHSLNPVTIEMINNLNTFFNNRIKLSGLDAQLKDRFQSFDVVIGAGRVAIEALISGCYVFALGEAKYHGLVTLENLEELMASNFGDIGNIEEEQEFDPGTLFVEVTTLMRDTKASDAQRKAISDKVRNEYDLSQIYLDIGETYKAARSRFFLPGGSPS